MRLALQQRGNVLMYSGVALISLYAGVLVARSEAVMATALLALLTLAGLVLLLYVPASTLFLGWLFLSPIFQVAADKTSLGRSLTWALYIAPALMLVYWTFARRRRVLDPSPMDWLPLAYLGYVLTSIALTTDALRANPTGSMKAIVTLIALGPIAYYFLTRGPGVDIPSAQVLAVLLPAALIQGILALVETTTTWSLWGGEGWLAEDQGWRATATLANPGVLGMMLGVGIVVAVAVLTWRGPQRLRLVSWAVLGVCTPALLATMTRGPVLATAVAVVLLLLLGNARLLGVAVLIATAVLVFAFLPALQKSDLYAERVAQSQTVDIRVAIQDVSLQLAEQKPVFGWGYGSFDDAKRASGYVAEGIPLASVLETTSHNTYLTILVELGALGFLLFALPFVFYGYRSLRQRPASDDRWLVAASLGSLAVIFLTGSTLDFRFFSISLMLPFVFLAILRRTTVEGTRGSGP